MSILQIEKDLSKLRVPSTDVETAEEAISIANLLTQLLDRTSNSVGLAAIQIGIPKRVGVIIYHGLTSVLINPELVKAKHPFVFKKEGCLSMPGTYLNTNRFKTFIIMNNRIKDGEFIREKKGFYYSSHRLLAIAVQHELDHFDGQLITDGE